uniref:Uncharacterized protein n=1 Tax=Salix viminalis TaxID=40686 RepID=A0A6N2KFV2_SALVM
MPFKWSGLLHAICPNACTWSRKAIAKVHWCDIIASLFRRCHTKSDCELKKLAFFAGAVNSQSVKCSFILEKRTSEIFAHSGRLKTLMLMRLTWKQILASMSKALKVTQLVLQTHYIIYHANTMIFHLLTFWKSFSVVVSTIDIPLLKKILIGISSDQYLMFQKNVLEVRKHFQWHHPPVDYDAFYMVMYELWLRRTSVRVPLPASMNPNH